MHTSRRASLIAVLRAVTLARSLLLYCTSCCKYCEINTSAAGLLTWTSTSLGILSRVDLKTSTSCRLVRALLSRRRESCLHVCVCVCVCVSALIKSYINAKQRTLSSSGRMKRQN